MDNGSLGSTTAQLVSSTPKIEIILNRARDAYERLLQVRAKLEAKNDKLFGSAPEMKTNSPTPPPAEGIVNDLQSMVDHTHEAIGSIEHEIERLSELT